MCHIRATAVQMKHQTHLSEGVVDAESRLGNRVPPRGIPALDIPRPFVRTVSPEGSYHYRFYRLAADNLPISPISYHPSADNTTILGNLPPLSVLFPALPCSLERAGGGAAHPDLPRHFVTTFPAPFRHHIPTFPAVFQNITTLEIEWSPEAHALGVCPPRLMLHAPKAYDICPQGLLVYPPKAYAPEAYACQPRHCPPFR